MKRFPNRFFTFFSLTFQACTCLSAIIFIYATLFLKTPPIVTNPQVTTFGFVLNKCYMRFRPNVDLTPLFNLNTKQIFLYATMVTGKQHEMVWSKIVQLNDIKKFYECVNNNYPFSVIEGADKYRTIEFELRANLFPFVGAMKDILIGKFKYTVK